MKLTKSPIFFPFIFHTSYGYVLDRSCEHYGETIIRGMQGAFDLAHAGEDTLHTLIGRQRSFVTWDAQIHLMRWLFSEALGPAPVFEDRALDPSKQEWQNVSNTFASVLRFNNNYHYGRPVSLPENASPFLFARQGLAIFCDFSRYRENENYLGNSLPGHAYDTTTPSTVQIMSGQYQSCKNGTGPGDVDAYISVEDGYVWPAYIQLCPWYLRKVQNDTFQTYRDFQGRGVKITLAKTWKKFSTWLADRNRTPMDVLSLFDGTLLRAMAGIVVNPTGIQRKRGWVPCVRLSESGGIYNPENYVFFGLGSRMISPYRGKAQKPLVNGKIVVLSDEAHAKRSPRGTHPPPLLGARTTHPKIALTMNHTSIKNLNDEVSLNTSSPNGTLQHKFKTGYDNSLSWESSGPPWFDIQQSILLEAMADNDDPQTANTTSNFTSMTTDSGHK